MSWLKQPLRWERCKLPRARGAGSRRSRLFSPARHGVRSRLRAQHGRCRGLPSRRRDTVGSSGPALGEGYLSVSCPAAFAFLCQQGSGFVCLSVSGRHLRRPRPGMSQLSGVSTLQAPLTGVPQGRLWPFLILSRKVFWRRIRISLACFSIVRGLRLYLL